MLSIHEDFGEHKVENIPGQVHLVSHMDVGVIWKRLMQQTLHRLGQITRVTWALQLDTTTTGTRPRLEKTIFKHCGEQKSRTFSPR